MVLPVTPGPRAATELDATRPWWDVVVSAGISAGPDPGVTAALPPAVTGAVPGASDGVSPPGAPEAGPGSPRPSAGDEAMPGVWSCTATVLPQAARSTTASAGAPALIGRILVMQRTLRTYASG